jgi:hypothetical protein
VGISDRPEPDAEVGNVLPTSARVRHELALADVRAAMDADPDTVTDLPAWRPPSHGGPAT